MKRQVTACIFVFILFLSFSIPILANSPMPAHDLTVFVSNKPESAVFCDLLIKINKTDSEYTQWNNKNGEKFGISENSEIAKFDKDGYRSFTFHYIDASSDIELHFMDYGYRETEMVADFAENEYSVESDINIRTQFEVLQDKYSDARFALLDKKGNVVALSNTFSYERHLERGYFVGSVNYDASSGTIQVSVYHSKLSAVFSAILLLILSIILEMIIAYFFGLKQVWKIALVNLATQIMMRILLTLQFAHYWHMVMILEVLIYIVEFGIYRLIYRKEHTKKLLLYTATANTISLVAGLICFYFKNLLPD